MFKFFKSFHYSSQQLHVFIFPQQCIRLPTSHLFCCCCLISKSCLTLLWSHGLQPVRFLCPWDPQVRMLEWVAISSFRGSSWPKDWTHISFKSPALAGRLFTTEPLKKSHIFSNTCYFPLIFYYYSYFTGCREFPQCDFQKLSMF